MNNYMNVKKKHERSKASQYLLSHITFPIIFSIIFPENGIKYVRTADSINIENSNVLRVGNPGSY